MLDAKTYEPHALHRGDRAFVETNCFVDLWIELLHGLGLEPRAALPFSIRTDLEGDQFTFFKFPFADLEALYGIEIFELNVWHRLVDHVSAEVRLGRPVVIEVDAFFLPDTKATTYRNGHGKTSIAAMSLDREGERLGYFHNAGYYELEGDDFRGLFRIDDPKLADQRFGKTVYSGSDYLAPYIEVVRVDAIEQTAPEELERRSLALLAKHVGRLPRENPISRYRERFPCDLAWLTDPARRDEAADPLAGYHAYSFANLRQLGASIELSGSYLEWLALSGVEGLDEVRGAASTIVNGTKTLQFKLARAASGRPIDADALITPIETAWDVFARGLRARFGNG